MIDSQVTKNWKVANQEEHNRSLLRVLNTANLKMLQSLPTVGPKTAYLIHSHRWVLNAFERGKSLHCHRHEIISAFKLDIC